MRRHRFDPFSFLFGALFLVVGITFLFGRSGVEVARPERLWAAAAVVVGASLALWAVARVVRKDRSVMVAADGGATEPDIPSPGDVDATSATAASDDVPEEPGSP
jgi:hypothetical protein